ncbi:MAG: hypothetical protein ACW98Y_12610, partial [Candidatus Thorarchaeota archaeon]
IHWIKSDREEALQLFMTNYASFNVAARMTVLILAKRYRIPLPEGLKKDSPRKSRFSSRNK